MKKGFTLIEVMATIVILAIVLIIAVPVYNGVRDRINENIYESKIQEVLAKLRVMLVKIMPLFLI